VTNVWLHYAYTGQFKTTVPMVGTNPYTFNFAPDFAETGMDYHITAVDAAGNLFTSPMESLELNDTDVPVLVNDYSDPVAYTGDDYLFDIRATDNVAITSAKVVYHFGSDSPTTSDLISGGGTSYSLTITVPSDSLESLQYHFVITDNAGNVLNTELTI